MLSLIRLSLPTEKGVCYLTVKEGEGARETLAVLQEDYLALGAPTPPCVLNEEETAQLRRAAALLSAKESALRILSFGDNSRASLFRKLVLKKIDRAVAEEAVSFAVEKGYLQEERQVYRQAVLLATQKCFGKKRILAALMQKGYPASLISQMTEKAEEEGDIDFAALKARLVQDKLGDAPDYQETKKLLWKYGY